MYAVIAAEIANQRHGEFVAQAEARRAVALARESRRAADSSGLRSRPFPRRRPRPIGALSSWIAAGQL